MKYLLYFFRSLPKQAPRVAFKPYRGVLIFIFINIFADQKSFFIDGVKKSGIIYDTNGIKLQNKTLALDSTLTTPFGVGKVKIPDNYCIGTYTSIKNSPALLFVPEQRELSNKFKVIIDPGHGGEDLGAAYFGYQEKDLALKIAKKVVNLLRKQNIPTILTRTTDITVPLEKRASLAQNYDGLYVSIHINSAPNSSVRGIETFWCDPREINWFNGKSPKWGVSGYKFAQTVHNSLVKLVPGELDRGVKHGSPVVLVGNMHLPAILIECGFLSNSDEAKMLASAVYQDKIAKYIVDGINGYLENFS